MPIIDSNAGYNLRHDLKSGKEDLINPIDPVRDSELSGGKYDDNLEKFKKSRINVQNRLV